MTTIPVLLDKALTPMPVKAFLKQHQGISNTIWKRIKHSGTFCINDVQANAARSTVSTGDTVSYDILRPSNIEAENIPLDVRYEDEWLLIINKPAGQLVHPTTREPHGTLGGAVMHWYQQHSEEHAFHPVHRLDRETSGLVLIAKQPQVQYQLSPKGVKQFHREYQAIIPGRLIPPAGLIDAPIARALPSIILRKVSPEGKAAQTCYKTLKTNGQLSLLQLELETGRTHQIRVHLAHLGHPLIGDDLYGGSQILIGRQALHAFRLRFMHPMTGQPVCVTAPLPDDMKQIVATL